ncbi:SOS response-associated peptidase [Hazenella sp. IB182357]|uniref:Abasic site processing protein n=1 Tax=Polycladospora coralii TaxID=2771432 RepID=A0A926N8S1_9BACL|nr:SOS response-associated peptidase [Polycladospora coralii]MBD1371442.1 SOS response-associated peptidase [Polycladospora coralii]
MCGRFTLYTPKHTLQDRFQFELMDDVSTRYNIAPSQLILSVVNDHGKRKGVFLRWGLIPSWVKDQKIGYKMINARAETVDEKPSYRRLLARKRCLILANGFYEWKKTDNGKQPYLIGLKSGKPFAFCGLWDQWQAIYSCTIITTKPNGLMKPIHGRMPSILQRDDEETWLDPNISDSAYLKSLLHPYSDDDMTAVPVSTLVNSPRNDTAECLNPISM